MPVLLDLEGNETDALLDIFGDVKTKQVLEIGSGDGRLTWRYAKQVKMVTGIDPSLEKVERARQGLPPDLQERVKFHATDLEQFHTALRRKKRYDLALLSWSL